MFITKKRHDDTVKKYENIIEIKDKTIKSQDSTVDTYRGTIEGYEKLCPEYREEVEKLKTELQAERVGCLPSDTRQDARRAFELIMSRQDVPEECEPFLEEYCDCLRKDLDPLVAAISDASVSDSDPEVSIQEQDSTPFSTLAKDLSDSIDKINKSIFGGEKKEHVPLETVPIPDEKPTEYKTLITRQMQELHDLTGLDVQRSLKRNDTLIIFDPELHGNGIFTHIKIVKSKDELEALIAGYKLYKELESK